MRCQMEWFAYFMHCDRGPILIRIIIFSMSSSEIKLYPMSQSTSRFMNENQASFCIIANFIINSLCLLSNQSFWRVDVRTQSTHAPARVNIKKISSIWQNWPTLYDCLHLCGPWNANESACSIFNVQITSVPQNCVAYNEQANHHLGGFSQFYNKHKESVLIRNCVTCPNMWSITLVDSVKSAKRGMDSMLSM